MSNIADMIEAYILQRLAEQQDGKVDLRRSDIAGEISCAPSQISYVLNTRFTMDKGFAVESRRGLGGFIRIVRVPVQDVIYQEMIDSINENTDFEEIKNMARYLVQHQMITSREAALILQAVSFSYVTMEPVDRVAMIQSMLNTLMHFS